MSLHKQSPYMSSLFNVCALEAKATQVFPPLATRWMAIWCEDVPRWFYYSSPGLPNDMRLARLMTSWLNKILAGHCCCPNSANSSLLESPIRMKLTGFRSLSKRDTWMAPKASMKIAPPFSSLLTEHCPILGFDLAAEHLSWICLSIRPTFQLGVACCSPLHCKVFE